MPTARRARLQLLVVIASSAVFPQAAPGEERYSLFNPAPRELWRPMSADRPDITESPRTVDAGAVQIELSFVDYAEAGDAKAWAVPPANLKVGLLDNADLQLVLTPYARFDDGVNAVDGLGDTQVRLKVNLWGNEGGETAFGIMPFVKIPTASDGLGNDHVEGGLILPFGTDVSSRVGLGLMVETDFVFDVADDAFDTELVTTAVLGLAATERVGFYLEGVGVQSSDSAVDYRAIVGSGATYALSEHLVIDAGVNVGATGETDDVNVFAGATIRP